MDSLLKQDWIYYQSYTNGKSSFSKITDTTYLMRSFRHNDTAVLNMSGLCMIPEYYKSIDSILIYGNQIYQIKHLTTHAMVLKCLTYSELYFGYVEGYYNKENPVAGKQEVDAFMKEAAALPREDSPYWKYIPYGKAEEPIQLVVNIPARFNRCDQEKDVTKLWNCHLSEFSAFVHSNLNYPDEAASANIQGTVLIAATVEKDGTVNNPIVVSRVGGGCDEEALRLVKSLPKLAPAIKKGEVCRVISFFPVNFSLDK